MKILYVLYALADHGGLERIMVEKMNYLCKIYHYEISVVTMSQRALPIPYGLSDKITHIDLGINSHSKYKLHFLKRLFAEYYYNKLIKTKLLKVIDHTYPDIIVCTTYWGLDIVSHLKFSGKRILESHVTLGNLFDYDEKNAFQRLRWQPYLKCASRYDILVTLTKGDALRWEKYSDHVMVIPNVISCKQDVIVNSSSRRIIAVGRLVRQKGFDNLIKVWALIEQKYPDWSLDIYGDGELHDILNRDIEIRKLSNIRLRGVSDNIFDEYSKSSIFVMPSRFEGFSLVLAEAMSCGLACVSFDCPYGPSEIIKNGEDGILVENGNITALADKLCFMIENEVVRREMGMKARENVKRYLPENIMPLWKQLFESLVGNK